MSATASANRSTALPLLLLAGSLGVAALLGEALVRLMGHAPYTPPAPIAAIEPGGRLFAPDPELGYTHLPGVYDVTMSFGHRFRMSHGSDGLRLTSASTPGGSTTAASPPSGPPGGEPAAGQGTSEASERPAIWLFGGSFTHGWLLDDADTFAWLLQRRFPGHEIVNFGVSGYGTLHGMIQFERALRERPAPAIVVVVYGWFHDERNVALRRYRKGMATHDGRGFETVPRARLDDDGELQWSPASLRYRPWPGMRVSALVHFLERLANRLEARTTDGQAVTRAILEHFDTLCAERGIRLAIAGLVDEPTTRGLLDEWSARGIPTRDISVDTANPALSFTPDDNHPNGAANLIYADRLESLLLEVGARR